MKAKTTIVLNEGSKLHVTETPEQVGERIAECEENETNWVCVSKEVKGAEPKKITLNLKRILYFENY